MLSNRVSFGRYGMEWKGIAGHGWVVVQAVPLRSILSVFDSLYALFTLVFPGMD